MKIKIKSDNKKFTLFIPCLFGAYIIKSILKEGAECNYSVVTLNKELKKARKNFGHIKIIDVESSSGENIEITL